MRKKSGPAYLGGAMLNITQPIFPCKKKAQRFHRFVHPAQFTAVKRRKS